MNKEENIQFLDKNLDIHKYIYIKGAKMHNLKNIDVDIPKNKLVCVTGVSGSGKTTLIMDTLFAEGQRRYVESLSSYARQFLMRMKKPEVDYIKGIAPAIAIEQKVTTGNVRSTVGSMTEIYEFLRLLYARAGKMYSPISGQEVRKHSVSDVVNFIWEKDEKAKMYLLIPLQNKYVDRKLTDDLNILLGKGYTRVLYNDTLVNVDELSATTLDMNIKAQDYKDLNIFVLVDRFVLKKADPEFKKRVADSVRTAFNEGQGQAYIYDLDTKESIKFSNKFELDGMTFIEPSPQLFNYNNPLGACTRCEGYGKIIGISEDKVISNTSLSVADGCIAPWKSGKSEVWLQKLLTNAHYFDFPVHTPYEDLSDNEKTLLWTGNKYFNGINAYFKKLEQKLYKIQNRVLLARYRGRTNCTACKGYRVKNDALYVKLGGKHIGQLTQMPIDELVAFFKTLDISEHQKQIAKRLLMEINNRLSFMQDVGLGYLELSRLSSTLSGGESQRINLTRTLGSNLTASIYILDEPSIGLHPKDTKQLVAILKKLRDLGNTVVVIEHEEEVIKNADYLIDVGNMAGINGGKIVAEGDYKTLMNSKIESLTLDYLKGKKSIPTPQNTRQISHKIKVNQARANNLKGIDVHFPLQALSVVTGVSGSGKTTLVKSILYPELQKMLGQNVTQAPGTSEGLSGDLKLITQVEMVNQRPIGRSSRSNPITYMKIYDDIRALFVRQQLAKIRGYKPGHFSFNVEGGRCETCKGDGEQLIEMQFLADVRLTCEDCGGKRFKSEILDIKYKDKNVFDVLSMSIDEAIEFFENQKEIASKLQILSDVGLGYVQCGQSASTLSGGEAQRVKLASFLAKERSKEHIFFIFDEPTTGLHYHDVNKLLIALNRLVENGHTVLLVEHDPDVIKTADWVIDLGPDGGKGGGNLVFEGVPRDLAKCKESYTGTFLNFDH